MSYKRSCIIELLKTYSVMKVQIEQLRYELQESAHICTQEIMNDLALNGSTRIIEGTQTHHISDRTMSIAIRYRNDALQMRRECESEITNELRTLESETERLEHYISLLDEQKAIVLRMYYFERKAWQDIESVLHLHKRTLQGYRNAAIDDLVVMYSYISRYHDY